MKKEKLQLTRQKCEVHKRLLQTATCQKSGQPRINEQIVGRIQLSKIEPGRIIKQKQTNHN